MSIAQKLLDLNQLKSDIKDAIEQKGVMVDDAPFTDYPNKILEIEGGGGTLVYPLVKVMEENWETTVTEDDTLYAII